VNSCLKGKWKKALWTKVINQDRDEN
jgi:hypothetical protein